MENTKAYKFIDALFFVFTIFAILSYTELPLHASIVKPIVQLLFILLTVKSVDIRNYIWVSPLILVMIVWPLVAILLNIYNYNTTQVLLYTAAFLLMLVFIVCVSNVYKARVTSVINIWFYALNLSFLVLFILYRGISLNLGYLLHAIITNDRYGSDKLIQRYSMGFTNINTFALFATILLLCAFYKIVHHKKTLLSLIDVVIGTVFILNSESRSPLFVILMLTIIYLILSIKNKGIRLALSSIIIILLLGYSIIFIYLMIRGNKLSETYNAIDSFSTFRLSFGSQAIGLLSQYGNVMFGLGPMSTTYITNNIFGKSVTLDVSFEYYIFTLGIIGTILIYAFLGWLFSKLVSIKKDHKFAIIIMAFYFIYSLFENILFIPNSTASIFCLSLIFTYLATAIDHKQR